MNRLAVRIALSHLLAILVVGVTTFVIVRMLAPQLFADHLRHSGGGMGQGARGGPMLRESFADSVDRALLLGLVVGTFAAMALALFAASRLLAPLRAVQAATRRMAQGKYSERIQPAKVTELAALAADVNSRGEALEQTEARRVRLLGEVAHEMRTPLTVIEGSIEGMIDGILPKTAEELGQVGHEVRRLRRLAEDLSALSRAAEGRLALKPAPVDLREVVAAAAERLRPQVVDAGLELVVHPAEGTVPVDVDADRISQVVTNLIGNAVRATPAGGRIEVQTLLRGQRAEFRVTDTGEGLAAEDLERIFERFYRAPDRAQGGADPGSGIGLTISRSIVESHGGTVTAHSAGRGHGSTFTVSLPRT